MKKNIPKKKIILITFALFFILYSLFLIIPPVFAQIEFKPQVDIPPGIKVGESIKVGTKTLADYIQNFYRWSVTAIAIIAVIMIMISGIQWLTAAGNAPLISQAKDRMISAIIGLILALITVPLLRLVNPALVDLEAFKIPEIIRTKESGPPNMTLFLKSPDFGFNESYILNFGGYKFCGESFPNTKSGSGQYIGGGRRIWATLYFADNRQIDKDKVKITAIWSKVSDPNFSITKDTKESWDIVVDNSEKEVCKKYVDVEEKKCTWIRAFEKDNQPLISWLINPNLAKNAGKFKIKMTFTSTANPPQFEEVTGEFEYTQTCGLGIAGCPANNCCKKMVKPGENINPGRYFYYEYQCADDVKVNGKVKKCPEGWEEEKEKKFCGIGL